MLEVYFDKSLSDSSQDSFLESETETEGTHKDKDETTSMATDEREDTTSMFCKTIANYSEEEFKKNFRINRNTVNYIIERYIDECGFELFYGVRKKVGSKRDIYIYLWFVTHSLPLTELALLFGTAKSKIWRIINRVSSWLIVISPDYIYWPKSDRAIRRASAAFEDMHQIPNVIGAIDATHIQIARKNVFEKDYSSGPDRFSIIIQAVAAADQHFISIHCGEPGSLTDAEALETSPVYAKGDEISATNTFLLGDSDYPLRNWCVTPYPDNGQLDSQQQRFNFLHSSTRSVVENAINLLKRRFLHLQHFTERLSINIQVNIIYSTCVVHNICIHLKDGLDDVKDEFMADDDVDLFDDVEIKTDPDKTDANNKRDELFEELIKRGIL